MIAIVAIHSSVPPYCAVIAGPNNHSPLPIEAPKAIIPGPNIFLNALPNWYCGGAGSSSTSQSGSVPPFTRSFVSSIDYHSQNMLIPNFCAMFARLRK